MPETTSGLPFCDVRFPQSLWVSLVVGVEAWEIHQSTCEASSITWPLAESCSAVGPMFGISAFIDAPVALLITVGGPAWFRDGQGTEQTVNQCD